MNKFELCGYSTPRGPCTLKKGHKLNYHRHRTYQHVSWVVKNADTDEVIDEGNARVPLNYAITDALDKCENIIVELTRWES